MVFKDIFSGDTMCSVAYQHTKIFNGSCLEVEASKTKGANPVINLVSDFKLKSLNLSKDEFNGWYTLFEKNCKEKNTYSENNGKLKEFILNNFEKISVFRGPSMAQLASLEYASWGLAFAHQ